MMSQESQRIEVTGSRIKRADVEGALPVTVVTREELEASGQVTVADFMRTVSFASFGNFRPQSGSSAQSFSEVNLRGLRSRRTLVLIDGRRVAKSPNVGDAADINSIPMAAVERIEILTDGASAIYGSDAMGGVINYVLKKNFNGAETVLKYGMPEHGGGESLGAALTFGTSFADGRGRIFGTLETLFRDSIELTARDFSQTSLNNDRAPEPFNGLGGPFADRTPRGIWPTFRVGSATRNNYFRPVDGTPVLTTAGPSRSANPEFYLDLNQYGWSSPRVRRANSYLSGEFDLNDTITAFADVSYYKARSTMRRQPLALNAPTSDALKVLAIDNPYNPYGSAFYHPTGAPRADGAARLVGEPTTISLVSLTLPDLAAESIDTESDVVRFSAGLKGRIGETWTWESSAFYNRVEGQEQCARCPSGRAQALSGQPQPPACR